MKTHNLQHQTQPWRHRALNARHPLNYHPKSGVVCRVRGNRWVRQTLQLSEGRRRVSVVGLPAQNMEKEVKSRCKGISSVNCLRDLAENFINGGV